MRKGGWEGKKEGKKGRREGRPEGRNGWLSTTGSDELI